MNEIKKKSGFTLIELLVVISIIGLLSTLAIVALNNSRAKARDTKRLADLKQIQTALELYYDKYGHYPYEADANSGSTGKIGPSYTGGINSILSEFMSLPEDPLDNSSTYYYYYDAMQNCTGGPGSPLSVVFARTMESTPGNASELCPGGWGGEGGAGSASAYHIIITPTGQ